MTSNRAVENFRRVFLKLTYVIFEGDWKKWPATPPTDVDSEETTKKGEESLVNE